MYPMKIVGKDSFNCHTKMQKLRGFRFSPSRNNFKRGSGEEKPCFIFAFLNLEIMDSG